jgi:hypothetical protein
MDRVSQVLADAVEEKCAGLPVEPCQVLAWDTTFWGIRVARVCSLLWMRTAPRLFEPGALASKCAASMFSLMRRTR